MVVFDHHFWKPVAHQPSIENVRFDHHRVAKMASSNVVVLDTKINHYWLFQITKTKKTDFGRQKFSLEASFVTTSSHSIHTSCPRRNWVQMSHITPLYEGYKEAILAWQTQWKSLLFLLTDQQDASTWNDESATNPTRRVVQQDTGPRRRRFAHVHTPKCHEKFWGGAQRTPN